MKEQMKIQSFDESILTLKNCIDMLWSGENNEECITKLSDVVDYMVSLNKVLKRTLRIFRREYPKRLEQEMIKEFGDLGQPFEILRELEKVLEEK